VFGLRLLHVEIMLLAPGQRGLPRKRRAIAVVAGREAEQKSAGESEERGTKPARSNAVFHDRTLVFSVLPLRGVPREWRAAVRWI
jgi:hypothetical protein